jgi:hypothetical protein
MRRHFRSGARNVAHPALGASIADRRLPLGAIQSRSPLSMTQPSGESTARGPLGRGLFPMLAVDRLRPSTPLRQHSARPQSPAPCAPAPELGTDCGTLVTCSSYLSYRFSLRSTLHPPPALKRPSFRRFPDESVIYRRLRRVRRCDCNFSPVHNMQARSEVNAAATLTHTRSVTCSVQPIRSRSVLLGSMPHGMLSRRVRSAEWAAICRRPGSALRFATVSPRLERGEA